MKFSVELGWINTFTEIMSLCFQVKLSDYIGKKYVILFFYPLDFTFVCPTGNFKLSFTK